MDLELFCFSLRRLFLGLCRAGRSSGCVRWRTLSWRRLRIVYACIRSPEATVAPICSVGSVRFSWYRLVTDRVPLFAVLFWRFGLRCSGARCGNPFISLWIDDDCRFGFKLSFSTSRVGIVHWNSRSDGRCDDRADPTARTAIRGFSPAQWSHCSLSFGRGCSVLELDQEGRNARTRHESVKLKPMSAGALR